MSGLPLGTESDDVRCDHCGRTRPTDGWLPIEDSPYDWLGFEIANRYRLQQHIGQGGMGQVYRATDRELRRDLAAKIVEHGRSPHVSPEQARSQLRAEVLAIAKVHSPHVVDMVDVLDIDEQTTVVLMEYVPGDDLDALVTRAGSLPAAQALGVARQIAIGLRDAHRCGLVHRDIKPANIVAQPLDTRTYFVRILDFGIVQVDGWSGLNDEHAFWGSPRYAPPEQASRAL